MHCHGMGPVEEQAQTRGCLRKKGSTSWSNEGVENDFLGDWKGAVPLSRSPRVEIGSKKYRREGVCTRNGQRAVEQSASFNESSAFARRQYRILGRHKVAWHGTTQAGGCLTIKWQRMQLKKRRQTLAFRRFARQQYLCLVAADRMSKATNERRATDHNQVNA